MSFKEAVQSVFSKYCCFEGRARRSEFWYFCLFTFIVAFVLSFICNLLFGSESIISTVITGAWSLAILLPSLGVMWRRLHDIGKSGAWYFIGLVPIVGAILLIVWCCKDSEPGTNQYGPNPKENA